MNVKVSGWRSVRFGGRGDLVVAYKEAVAVLEGDVVSIRRAG